MQLGLIIADAGSNCKQAIFGIGVTRLCPIFRRIHSNTRLAENIDHYRISAIDVQQIGCGHQ